MSKEERKTLIPDLNRAFHVALLNELSLKIRATRFESGSA